MKRDAEKTVHPAKSEAVVSAIERAKRELEQMIDLNPQGMLLVDRMGTVVRANRAMLELLAANDFQWILQRPIGSLFTCDDSEVFSRLLGASTGYESSEIIARTPDNRQRTLRFTVVNSGGKSDLSVVIVRDITGEKEAEKHLEKKHKREALQEIVGALMHNINQPLTVILARAHLLGMSLEKSGVATAALKKDLHDIVSLTMEIAETLRLLEVPQDYVTQPYADGVDIVDIEKTGTRAGRWKAASVRTLDSIMQILDIHEPGALLHSKRTAEYAIRMARLMSLGDDKVEIIRIGATYHDIGKSGIPDNILQKPSSLTADEKQVVNRHPEIGYTLLRTFSFLTDEAEIAYSHHERCDGKGYPRGLVREKIPIIARIVAVADAFDALRFYRYYHHPSPLDSVVKEIRAGVGTQFDPDVVAVFLKCYRDLDAIFPHTAAPQPAAT